MGLCETYPRIKSHRRCDWQTRFSARASRDYGDVTPVLRTDERRRSKAAQNNGTSTSPASVALSARGKPVSDSIIGSIPVSSFLGGIIGVYKSNGAGTDDPALSRSVCPSVRLSRKRPKMERPDCI